MLTLKPVSTFTAYSPAEKQCVNHIEHPEIEMRRQRRRRKITSGIVICDDLAIAIDCVITDYHSNGARLKLDSPTQFPSRFKLVIPSDGVEVKCELKWQDSNELGVIFSSEPLVDHRHIRKHYSRQQP